MKVTIIGAGNVGASCADAISYRQIANEIVLLDIKEGFAEGKAMDMMQCATHTGFNSVIKGVTNDYSQTANSDVVVVTSGVPRKPGMTREELIDVNAKVVQIVMEQALKYSPDAIFVLVTNPLDSMAYWALKLTGLPKNRIIGMGGALDSARFRYFLAQKLNKPINDIDGMVIGGHGDTTMIPLIRFATYAGIPVEKFLTKEEQDEVVAATMVGGATLTKLLGTSAWYAPGASVAAVVDSILNDRKRLITCSVLVEGEYGADDLFIGVPCVLGKQGLEEIVDLKLNNIENEKFQKSVAAVREMNQGLRKFLE